MGTCDKLQASGAYKLINLNLKKHEFWKGKSFTSKDFCISLVLCYYIFESTSNGGEKGSSFPPTQMELLPLGESLQVNSALKGRGCNN